MASRRGNAARRLQERTVAPPHRHYPKGIAVTNRQKTKKFPDGAEQVQVILTKPQDVEIKKLSVRVGLSVSELIRRIVDRARQPA